MEKKFGTITLKTLPADNDVMLDMALKMVHCVRENNAAGKDTVMIVPVGPTAQYPIFAAIANEIRLDLSRVHLFNMDEYLLTPTQRIADDHQMSFHRRMKTDLYDRLDPAITIPEAQRHFPDPSNMATYDKEIADLGGADLCLGGIGINGHIAFNEPPEKDAMISADEFAALPTRVLPISRETIVANAIGYQRGDLRGMPEYCVTVGMNSILAAKEIYLALSRDWQHGIVKRILTGPVTAEIPCSLLQRHPLVTICSPAPIAEGL